MLLKFIRTLLVVPHSSNDFFASWAEQKSNSAVLCVAEHRHAPPVGGGEPAGVRQVRRLRQDVRLGSQVSEAWQ